MEIILVVGAGIAVAGAIHARQNNPDRQMAQQEKAAYAEVKRAKKRGNTAEIHAAEKNAKDITIERLRQTMERSNVKMVTYSQEGSFAKAEKHKQRAAQIREQLAVIAPEVLAYSDSLHQQQQNPVAIPVQSHDPGATIHHASWPPVSKSSITGHVAVIPNGKRLSSAVEQSEMKANSIIPLDLLQGNGPEGVPNLSSAPDIPPPSYEPDRFSVEPEDRFSATKPKTSVHDPSFDGSQPNACSNPPPAYSSINTSLSKNV